MAEELRAAGTAVEFADPISDLLGRAIGAGPDLGAIHGLVLPTTAGDAPASPFSQQSFHPYERGTTLYADALNRARRELGL